VSRERDYVLGTHDEEIERLGLQHRVWRPRALDAWRRAGFTVGQTILDVGCGPGYASVDLAEIAGPSGRVVAIDRSRRFLDALASSARSRALTHLETHERDLDDDAPLPASGADGAWARWVFAFVRDPRRLLERTAAALRPGGTFVSHEYFDYRTWRVTPRSAELEAFVAQVIESWRATGGEPDIGLELPVWLLELGFEIRSARPIVDVVTPSSFVWEWPKAFIDVGAARLVELGRMSPEEAAALQRSFAASERNPRTLLVTPAVLEIIAVKNR
jgi:SAM-dependent methyltransferase